MKVAIVTGGSGGIGRCTAHSLAEAGCRVFELSRHGESDAAVEHVTCDVTDEGAVRAAVAEVTERAGRVDILVCNAGFGISGAAELTSSADAHAQLELNLFGMDNAVRAVLPQMRARYADVLPLGAGCCHVCKECTYPDAPCRFPEQALSSMEAYGLLVSQSCTDCGLRYNYGPNIIAYTGCFLFCR